MTHIQYHEDTATFLVWHYDQLPPMHWILSTRNPLKTRKSLEARNVPQMPIVYKRQIL